MPRRRGQPTNGDEYTNFAYGFAEVPEEEPKETRGVLGIVRGNQFAKRQAEAAPPAPVKTFEERETQYYEAKARIFGSRSKRYSDNPPLSEPQVDRSWGDVRRSPRRDSPKEEEARAPPHTEDYEEKDYDGKEEQPVSWADIDDDTRDQPPPPRSSRYNPAGLESSAPPSTCITGPFPDKRTEVIPIGPTKQRELWIPEDQPSQSRKGDGRGRKGRPAPPPVEKTSMSIAEEQYPPEKAKGRPHKSYENSRYHDDDRWEESPSRGVSRKDNGHREEYDRFRGGSHRDEWEEEPPRRGRRKESWDERDEWWDRRDERREGRRGDSRRDDRRDDRRDGRRKERQDERWDDRRDERWDEGRDEWWDGRRDERWDDRRDTRRGEKWDDRDVREDHWLDERRSSRSRGRMRMDDYDEGGRCYDDRDSEERDGWRRRADDDYSSGEERRFSREDPRPRRRRPDEDYDHPPPHRGHRIEEEYYEPDPVKGRKGGKRQEASRARGKYPSDDDVEERGRKGSHRGRGAAVGGYSGRGRGEAQSRPPRGGFGKKGPAKVQLDPEEAEEYSRNSIKVQGYVKPLTLYNPYTG